MKKFKLLGIAILCMFIACTTLTFPTNVEAKEATKSSAISFSKETGAYIQDEKIYYFDGIGNTQLFDVEVEHPTSVALDETTIYVQTQDATLYAFDRANKDVVLKNESLKGAGVEANTSLFIDENYVYATIKNRDKASIVRFDKTLNDAKKVDGSYRPIDHSNPYKVKERLFYTAESFGYMDSDGTGYFTQLSGDDDLVASAYDETTNIIFGVDTNGVVEAVDFETKQSYLSPYSTTMSVEGSDVRAYHVDGMIVFSAKEDDKLVLYLFNGTEFIKQETQLDIETTNSVSFHDGLVYAFDDTGKLNTAELQIPTKVQQSDDAKQLASDIVAFDNQYDPYNNPLDLSKQKEVDALQQRYTDLGEQQQKGVFNYAILKKNIDKLVKQQLSVDTLNATIASFVDVEALTREDTSEVKDAYAIYDKLNPAANQHFINNKLMILMEKVAAFDSEETIRALPSYKDVRVEDLPQVQNARKQYEGVVTKWKKEVTNISDLVQLENKIYDLLGNATLGDAYWPNFAGNSSLSATTETKTPKTSEEVIASFEKKGAYQQPIIVDDRIYVVRDRKYLSVMDNTGNVIAEAALYSNVGFFSRIAYGDGKIFVPLGSRIQAFDAKTLKPLWLSEDSGAQMISTITYHDGFIYSGVTTGGGGGTSKTDGFFFGMEVKDQDPTNSFENKNFTWKSGSDAGTGFYWAGGAVVNQAIVVAGDEGKLISHDLKTGKVIDTYPLGNTRVRTNVAYDREDKSVYVGTQDTHTLFKIKMKDDGSFQKNAVQSNDQVGEITGGIAIYKNRAYVPSGGMYAAGFSVVDTTTMDIAYQIGDLGTQSYPLISTAYAKAENNYKVYVYVFEYTTGKLMVLEDEQGQTQKIQNVLTNGYGTYNSGSITPDGYGNLYSSGSGAMYAIRSVNAGFTSEDMELAIKNFPPNFTYANKTELRNLRKQFDKLSKSEQAKVKNQDVLFGYEIAMNTLTNEKIAAIQSAIDTLPTTITLNEKTQIEQAIASYADLLEIDKLRVENYEILQQAKDTLQGLLGSTIQINAELSALNIAELTLENQGYIQELYARYLRLSNEEKALVTQYDKLEKAMDKMQFLNDQTLVPALIRQIDKLPGRKEITLAHEIQIIDAYVQYEKLHKDAQKEVTNASVLSAAYSEIQAQRASVDSLNDDIWTKLDPLHITLKDETNVRDFIKRYDALSKTNQMYIKYYIDVIEANEILASLHKGSIPASVFAKLQGLDKTYHFEGMMNNLAYTYEINGLDILYSKDFNATLNHTSAYDKAILKEYPNAYIIDMGEKGQLPGLFTLRLNVAFKDGTYALYMYENGKITKVKDINVLNNIAEFTIEKGATYFIDAPNNVSIPVAPSETPTDTIVGPDTSDNSNALLFMSLAIISLGCILVCIQREYKKRGKEIK